MLFFILELSLLAHEFFKLLDLLFSQLTILTWDYQSCLASFELVLHRNIPHVG